MSDVGASLRMWSFIDSVLFSTQISGKIMLILPFNLSTILLYHLAYALSILFDSKAKRSGFDP